MRKPNQNLIKYFKENSKKFGINKLRQQAINQGYPIEEVDWTINFLENVSSEKNREVTSSIFRSRFFAFILVSLGVLVLVSIGVFYFYSSPSENIQDSLRSSEEYTREIFTNYTLKIISAMSIDGDPFNLDQISKLKISSITDSIESVGGKIIFNGGVYSDLEIVNDGQTYYLKPVKFNGDYSDYLKIIKQESINPEDLFQSMTTDDIQEHIIKMFYYGIKENNSFETLNIELRNYLDLQKSEKKIEDYQIDEISGELILSYSNDDFPTLIEPALHANTISFLVDSYSNPMDYSSRVLEEYNKRLNDKKIMVINTQNSEQYYQFFNKEDILKDLSTLLEEDIDKNEKLRIIAGPVRYMNQSNVVQSKTSSLAGMAISSDMGQSELLDRKGAIVSPSRAIYYMSGPEYPHSKKSDFQIIDLKSTEGSFSAFIKNDYQVNIVQSINMNEASIENLAEVLSNPSKDIIYLNAHGGDKTLFLEIYYLGPSINPSNPQISQEYLSNLKETRSRVNSLWDAYGKESISATKSSYRLTKKDLGQFLVSPEAGVLGSLNEGSFDFIRIRVTDKFFDRYKENKKSLFILFACQGSSFVGSINSRVILAPEENDYTSIALFLDKDLKSIAPYLMKVSDLKQVAMNNENMRNYNIFKEFNQRQGDFFFADYSMSNEEYIQKSKECESLPNTICSIILTQKEDETIAVSPHVQSADGSKIEFNVPMDKDESIPPENIVTIDTSQCQISESELAELKPSWDSADGGDKIITLKWKDKVYRDWKDSDFSDGMPNVPYATMTVHQDLATSKISKVQLTGNTDCLEDTAKQPECWREPATIKWNGNHPNTDFTYAMPCIDEKYYKACEDESNIVKISKEDTEQPGFVFPDLIKVEEICYKKFNPTNEEKTKAVEIKKEDIEEDEACVMQCMNISEECMSNILISRTDEDGKQRLYINGISEPSCESLGQSSNNKNQYCFSPAAFENHIAWVRLETNPDGKITQSVVYNGKVIDSIEQQHYGNYPANIFEYSEPDLSGKFRGLQLYRDHIIYERLENDNKWHIIFDGQDRGVKDWNEIFIFGDHIAFMSENSVDFLIDGQILDQGDINYFKGGGDNYCYKKYDGYYNILICNGQEYNYKGEYDLGVAGFDIFQDNKAIIINDQQGTRSGVGEHLFTFGDGLVYHNSQIIKDDDLKKDRIECCDREEGSLWSMDLGLEFCEGGFQQSLNSNPEIVLFKDNFFFKALKNPSNNHYICDLTEYEGIIGVVGNQQSHRKVDIPEDARGFKLFGDHTSFFSPKDKSMYYNFNNVGKLFSSYDNSKELYDLFEDHFAYINSEGKLIYDGKIIDLTENIEPSKVTLYKNNVLVEYDPNSIVYYNGDHYPPAGCDYNSEYEHIECTDMGIGYQTSIVDNIKNCKKYYLETI